MTKTLITHEVDYFFGENKMFGSTPQKQIEKLEAKKAGLQAKITALDAAIAKLKVQAAATPAAPAPAIPQTAPVQTAPPPPPVPK